MRVEPATCPVCQRQYDPLRSRAVAVVDGKVRAYCSNACKEQKVAPGPAPAERRRYGLPATVLGLMLGLTVLIVGWRLLYRNIPQASASLTPPVVIPRPQVRVPSASEALAMLKGTDDSNDVWVHPIYGPKRWLPEHGSRRFGAAREGMRPDECEGGHCGVDIGTTRGVPVIAVHDGVIERVQRDAREGGRRGNEGRFIRINHKGGTIVTSYIHLDTIREDLKPGVPVKCGEELGSIGDTGVLRSGPHLHFAVSTRPSIDGSELYINPEPLLLLWPLKAPPTDRIQTRKVAARSAPHGG